MNLVLVVRPRGSGENLPFRSVLGQYPSESEYDSNDDHCSDADLKQGLVAWVNECQIKHCHVDKLLTLLQKAGHKLPSTATSLLKTVKDVPISRKSNMDYVYLGVTKQLQRRVNRLPTDQRELLTEVTIALNIDGLPLFKSANTCFWPVLCAVQNVAPVDVFPLAVACSSGLVGLQ